MSASWFARFVRGFCVGYLAVEASRQIGALALILLAVWFAASWAVDVTEATR